MWGYAARDVARLLGLSVPEVRRFARDGFVAPRRGPRNALLFTFQDLVLLRTAAGLVRAHVPAARVRRALRQLRAQLPAGRPLAAVHVSADGDRVVVRDGGASWHPETGQLVLDFDVAGLARKVAPLARAAVRTRALERLDADAWYALGCDLEPASQREAREAWRRALALDPDHPRANLDYGRLLHEDGDAAGAEVHYRRALAALNGAKGEAEEPRPPPAHRSRDSSEGRPERPGGPGGGTSPGKIAAKGEAFPDRVTAWFNLGVALEDQRRDDEALLAYARALRADPAHGDAHFNASRILERLGRRAEALRHLGAYRRLTRR
ncbi:MAG TPA: tetratricopeptide repeat protein [Anaeromyxobacteraceae bacterium]|nr:tetratricopeptide repeat protein [Anaeromyxobacteraceae bacterium]